LSLEEAVDDSVFDSLEAADEGEGDEVPSADDEEDDEEPDGDNGEPDGPVTDPLEGDMGPVLGLLGDDTPAVAAEEAPAAESEEAVTKPNNGMTVSNILSLKS
jgi:hypothetical protein